MRVAAADEEVAVPDQRRVDRDARLVERRAVAVDAGAAAQHVDRAGDDGDPPVPEPEQVPGRGQAARPVGGPDGGHARGLLARGVDDDERDRPGLQLPALRRVEVGEHEDDAARPAGQHVVEPLLPRPVRAAQLGQHHAHALGPGDGLDALDDLHRPARVELVEDEVEQPGPVWLRPRRRRYWCRSMTSSTRAAGHRGDVGPAVEHLGHGGDRDAGLGGDEGDGRSGDLRARDGLLPVRGSARARGGHRWSICSSQLSGERSTVVPCRPPPRAEVTHRSSPRR